MYVHTHTHRPDYKSWVIADVIGLYVPQSSELPAEEFGGMQRALGINIEERAAGHGALSPNRIWILFVSQHR